jgi:excisionase family DNA binding protein
MEAFFITSEADLKRLMQEVIREEFKNLLPDLQKQPVIPDDSLMTRVEMARYLKISLVTLTDWVKRGLPCIRKGGRVLFQKSEVLTAIKGHSVKPYMSKKSTGIPPKNAK